MRILHTSDWHLGQHFMGKSREAEHRVFVDWLIETIKEHQVNALIIAGDVFDTGTPPSYARKIYSQFIVKLQDTTCRQLVVLGGNHDSVATLHESRELLACLNTCVVGGVTQDLEEQVLVLEDQHSQPGAVLCAIPFIRPRDVLESQAGESGEAKQQALQQAIADHYHALYTLAKEKAGDTLPIIATGHLTTIGGELTESVREIYIGTLSAFPVSAFPEADYIALGHLHRPQRVANQEHIRYSGSPIPLSFDEIKTDKEVILADFEHGRVKAIQPMQVPLFRPLISLKGSLVEIDQALEALQKQSFDAALSPWLEIEIIADDYLSDLQGRVERLLQEKKGLSSFELLRVRRHREKSPASLSQAHCETLVELTAVDVFEQRLKLADLPQEQASRLNHAFQEILASLDEDQDVVLEQDAR
ncbi:exonuclease subunit SbcD [Kistimonas scapharcae]|uniref:Nuclease SbcCD subunit D n=1 Tax=Kistimonas scapharcae TaxID=1036133 RepID=A0ABP8V6C8_9GAMM